MLRIRNHRRGKGLALGAAVLGFTLAGCDSLLDVTLPGATPADALNDPTYATLLVTGVQADFECAFSNYVFISGHMSGELIGAQSALATIPYQRRDVRPVDQTYGEGDCGGNSGLYSPMSVARFVADDTFKRISEWTDAQVANRNRLLARSALYSGFSYTVFAEGWCRATFDLGPALTPAQVMALARDRFTQAIDLATQANDAETLNSALVGRARARLFLGENAAAAADARRVPSGFRKDVTRSIATGRTENDIFVSINRSRSHSIDPHFWDVRWQNVVDPRTLVVKQAQKGIDGLTDMYFQQKFTAASSPIRLASYVEAQLIIAEVEGGQTAVGVINALHTAANIPPFASTDAATIKAQVIEERRREFFLEGRRYGDLARFPELFKEAAGGQHPFVGHPYAETRCLPLPDVELRNNPNLNTGS
jgi:hypothetical protein